MVKNGLLTLAEAAYSLKISEDLIRKFIGMGLIKTVKEGRLKKITPYGFRRLIRILELYEQSFSQESIERSLNY